MKILSTAILSLLIALPFFGQELPTKSPKGAISQRVGLTDIEIDYSRPSVRERKIFGELVPYGEVWRFGANEPTKIRISRDIKVANQDLKKGTYAMFLIPKMEEYWTLVFNTDTAQWGAGSYDESKNVATVSVLMQEVAFTETMSLNFTQVGYDEAFLNFAWAEQGFGIRINVDTDVAAEENINAAIEKGEDLARVYYYAADFYMKQKEDLETAMANINKSIKLKEYYANVFQKAQILKRSGKDKDAIKTAEKAHKLALEAEKEGWANYIKGTIEEWSK